MNNILQQIVKDINEEKIKSVQPQALTKRGGEYRIGLSKAIDIVEEYAAQFAAPPPASEGEWTEEKRKEFAWSVATLAIVAATKNTKGNKDTVINVDAGIAAVESFLKQLSGKNIIEVLATLPTKEPEAKEKFAIRFSEWLMIQCDYKNHCVWEYQGEEYTQQELIEIFKRMTPSLPTQSITKPVNKI